MIHERADESAESSQRTAQGNASFISKFRSGLVGYPSGGELLTVPEYLEFHGGSYFSVGLLQLLSSILLPAWYSTSLGAYDILAPIINLYYKPLISQLGRNSFSTLGNSWWNSRKFIQPSSMTTRGWTYQWLRSMRTYFFV